MSTKQTSFKKLCAETQPSFPVRDERVGLPKSIKSHVEFSETDVWTESFDTGGPISLKYQSNACRLGNEALDEGMVAGNCFTGNLNFDICEAQSPICTEVLVFGVREMPRCKSE
jgi:hypothetical protein